MLTLRSYRAGDEQKVAGWLTDEDVFVWWSAGNLGSYPLDPQRLAQAYREGMADGTYMPMTLEDDGQVVGHMLMRWKERESGWIHFGYIVVDGEIRGRGYGSGMLRLALAHAFDVLHAARVTLNVFEANAPAIACYERLGFVRESERMMEIGGRSARVFRYEKTEKNA